MSHPRLYIVPKPGYRASLPALALSGDFGAYTSGEEFDGRIQIENSIGKCTVRVVSSSLPSDALIFVDNFTKEVVMRWAAYEPPGTVDEVPGSDFTDAANNKFWDLGEKWFIGPSDFNPADIQMNWGVMLGTDYATAKPVACSPATSITLNAEIEQGASSAGAAVGCCFLSYLDADYVELSRSEGNVVSSGSGGAREFSTVTAVAPPGTVYVSAGLRGTRTREAKRLYAHSMTWNHSYGTGTNGDVEFTVELEVTDSMGRTATASWGVAADPGINVIHLLRMNGASGSTSFPDETGKVWTAFGAAQVSTAQAKFGQSYFNDGTLFNGLFCSLGGDYGSEGSDPDLLQEHDFTVELWVRPTSLTGLRPIFQFTSAGTNNTQLFLYAVGGDLTLAGSGASWIASTGVVLAVNQWRHIAIVRKSGEGRLWVNGVLKGSAPSGGLGVKNTTLTGRDLWIGRDADTNWRFAGYFDEFRTAGNALYWDPFTPPAAPFPNP